MDYVTNYLNWLKENMTQKKLTDNITEITTPFLDRHNDYTQVYIIDNGNNSARLTDDSYIIQDLEASGIDVLTGKRHQLLKHTLQRLGISLDQKTHELYIDISNYNELAMAQHRLLQSMLDINDLFYLSRSNVKSIFVEEVTSFFDENDIFYTENMSVGGKTGYMHAFDFVLQKNKLQPERFIRLLNKADKSNMERVLFSWQDIKENRKPDSRLVVILNDTQRSIQSNVIDAFKQYDVSPLLWSNRQSYIPELR